MKKSETGTEGGGSSRGGGRGGSDSGGDKGSHRDSDGGSDSGSDSDSGSESDSESDSGGETVMKPIFIKPRKNRPPPPPKPKPQVRVDVSRDEPLDQEFDGTDDTDNVDPELEYSQWRQRELARYQRDRSLLAATEEEKDDRIRKRRKH